MLQLGEQIKEFIATMFSRGELSDPRVQHITVHSVKMTSDLQIAKVYYIASEKSKSSLKEVAAGLKAASPFIRRELGKQLQIRYIPQILFYFDDSIEYSLKMSGVMAKLKADRIENEKNNPPETDAESELTK